MINANELRIGNWVRYADDSMVPKIIESIDYDTFNGGLSYNEFEPIPLTHEILEKAGFINNYKGYSKYGYLKDGIKITSGRVDFFYYSNEHIRELEIKNVHQLQNLFFALTGTELEIVL